MRTLHDLIALSHAIYGRRNRIYASGGIDRINFLNLAIADLQDGLRKSGSKEKIAIALARITSRIFCVAEEFKELPLVEMLARKYPMSHCSYCRKRPCGCEERRADSKLVSEIIAEQLSWSLNDWCKGFAELYGAKNRERGIEYILLRLFKEVAELLSLQMRIPTLTDWPMEKVEEELALELADALAWTFAFANFFEIDLETAFIERYGNGCGKCTRNPCKCTHFSRMQMEW